LKSGLYCVRAGKEKKIDRENPWHSAYLYDTAFKKKDTGVTWKDVGLNGGAIR